MVKSWAEMGVSKGRIEAATINCSWSVVIIWQVGF